MNEMTTGKYLSIRRQPARPAIHYVLEDHIMMTMKSFTTVVYVYGVWIR